MPKPCESCRYYKEGGPINGTGLSRRYPPIPLVRERDVASQVGNVRGIERYVESYRPRVSRGDTCGEHKDTD